VAGHHQSAHLIFKTVADPVILVFRQDGLSVRRSVSTGSTMIPRNGSMVDGRRPIARPGLSIVG
jgi:hypothetical protein